MTINEKVFSKIGQGNGLYCENFASGQCTPTETISNKSTEECSGDHE